MTDSADTATVRDGSRLLNTRLIDEVERTIESKVVEVQRVTRASEAARARLSSSLQLLGRTLRIRNHLGGPAVEQAGAGIVPTVLRPPSLDLILQALKGITLLASTEELLAISGQLDERVREALSELDREAEEWAAFSDASLHDLQFFSHQLHERLTSMELGDEARHSAEQLQSDAAEAQAVLVAAKKSAGLVGDIGLADKYAELASAESKSANRFRWGTIFLVVAGVGIAGLTLIDGDPTVPLVIQRLALLASVFGLAGYLARQSHHHRMVATWSRSISVQLLTLDAYLAPLVSKEKQDDLRIAFASRVFGAGPKMGQEPGPVLSSDAMGVAAKLSKP
jgi:hypothetical protein